ncbi:indoleacetic acid-induced protein 8 [Actinidia rufa]|uniref:Auxin-responsive protein n=1 Tax=Actinidia rufa TaxID=165716 RepID=A0A7J0FI41_9ERIC|nr:indoleacetic acid-induced protein 8 [Actinidia rufa]
MSMPLQEHDYIGLSMEASDEKPKNKGLNLKATELRLGLPGSESPEREFGHGSKGLVSGAKRGFSDTINGGSVKWVFGSEADLAKNGGLFSPRGAETNTQQSSMGSGAVKEVVAPPSPKPVLPEKKPQAPAASGHGSAPAAKAQVVGWPPIRSFRKNSMASNTPKNDDDADAKSGSGCLYIKVSMEGAPYLRKVDLKTYGSYTELSSALEKMFSCFTIGNVSTNPTLTLFWKPYDRQKIVLPPSTTTPNVKHRNLSTSMGFKIAHYGRISPLDHDSRSLKKVMSLGVKICGSNAVPSRDGLSESRLMDLLHGAEYVLTYEDKDGDWMLVGDVPWEMFTGSCKRLRIMKSSDAIGLAPRAMDKYKNRN